MRFFQLPDLFDDITEHVEEATDLLAERATALGGVAPGTARLIAQTSSVEEYDLNGVSGEQHVKAVACGERRPGRNRFIH